MKRSKQAKPTKATPRSFGIGVCAATMVAHRRSPDDPNKLNLCSDPETPEYATHSELLEAARSGDPRARYTLDNGNKGPAIFSRLQAYDLLVHMDSPNADAMRKELTPGWQSLPGAMIDDEAYRWALDRVHGRPESSLTASFISFHELRTKGSEQREKIREAAETLMKKPGEHWRHEVLKNIYKNHPELRGSGKYSAWERAAKRAVKGLAGLRTRKGRPPANA